MYSSTPAIHTHSPWRKQRTWTKRVHEAGPTNHPHNGPSAHSCTLHNMAHVSHDVPPEAIQYAPPLSAYSAAHCGSSVACTEYSRALQMAAFTGVRDVPVLAPHVSQRLEKLRRIRATGYDTLAPIGLNRTMRELDDDAHLDEDDEDQGQAENSGNMGNPNSANLSSNQANMANPNSANLSMNSANLSANAHTSGHENPPFSGVWFPENDLDARIPDADLSDVSAPESLSRSDTPDAFMAADVEYQDDHSLIHDHVGQNSLDSHASFSTASVLSGANMATMPTVSTVATATSNLRTCDDSDVDMTLE